MQAEGRGRGVEGAGRWERSCGAGTRGRKTFLTADTVGWTDRSLGRGQGQALQGVRRLAVEALHAVGLRAKILILLHDL